MLTPSPWPLWSEATFGSTPAFFDRLAFVTVSANRPVTVLVSEQNDFEEWFLEEIEEFVEHEGYVGSYPPYHVAKQGVRAATTLKFYATEDRTFLVCLFNLRPKKTRATLELVHWSRAEEALEEEE